MERRLAAVFIADVVGYGRLSQIHEEGTRARSCAAIFRNRAGTLEALNEYLWILPYHHFEFSIVQ